MILGLWRSPRPWVLAARLDRLDDARAKVRDDIDQAIADRAAAIRELEADVIALTGLRGR